MKRYPFTEEDKKRIMTTADNIVKYMKAAGLMIQRYDSVSTLSVYLKFDFGLCGSLRISDHKSKDNLTYKYNVRTDVEAYYSNGEGATEANFFPIGDWEAACRMILIRRYRKIGKYGFEWYERTMNQTVSKKAFEKNRFWASCTHL